MSIGKTLLQKALSTKARQNRKSDRYNEQDLELAVAWLKDEVNAVQYMAAIGKLRGSNYLLHAASALRWGCKEKLIVVSKKRTK